MSHAFNNQSEPKIAHPAKSKSKLSHWLWSAKTQSRTRSGLRSRLETLEDRTVPAGLIDVTFQNGILKINGDAENNTLTLTQSADHRLVLTTDIGTGLKINGQSVQGFMGQVLSAPVSGGVTVNMGGGFDSFTLSGQVEDIELPSFLSINSGDGDNTVTFMQGVKVGGDVTIIDGIGKATTHLNDQINVLGKMTINNGKGGSIVDSNATTDLRIAGKLAVNSSTGFDNLDFTTAYQVILGGFSVNTGIDSAGSNTDLSPVNKLIVNGALSIANSNGDDLVDIGDETKVTKLYGAAFIANGAGSNHTDLAGSDSLYVGGPLTVNGGAGSDLVHLGINSNVVAFGNITVNNGAGNNAILINGTDLTVTGNILGNGGAGADTFDLFSTVESTISGFVNVSFGAGQNLFNAKGGDGSKMSIAKSLTFQSLGAAGMVNLVNIRNLKVQGITAINTGAGKDSVAINDCIFNSSFTLNTGAGDDNVDIEQDASASSFTQFNGPVLIATGANEDTVKISGVLAEPERKAIFASSAKFDGGTGVDILQLSEFGANSFYGAAPVKVGF